MQEFSSELHWSDVMTSTLWMSGEISWSCDTYQGWRKYLVFHFLSPEAKKNKKWKSINRICYQVICCPALTNSWIKLRGTSVFASPSPYLLFLCVPSRPNSRTVPVDLMMNSVPVVYKEQQKWNVEPEFYEICEHPKCPEEWQQQLWQL